MNYRHHYHAGNFADVFKHCLLITLVQHMQRKESPFCYLDTHAGIGCYDLEAKEALKTQEAQTGIFKLWTQDHTHAPAAVQIYLDIIQAWNTQWASDSLRYYLGSSMLVRQFLRMTDHMILTELHPDDVQILRRMFKKDKQVEIHHLDGYAAFKALLPPEQGRGLVLVDPPFEKTDDFEQWMTHLALGLTRWRAGIYAFWYPIKDRAKVDRFYADMQKLGISGILSCEMTLPGLDADKDQLNACGLIIVHPPWQFKEDVELMLPWLTDALAVPQTGHCHVAWLVEPE